MKQLRLVFLLILLTGHNLKAQVFFNSVPVDTLRYYEIEGNPYLYQTWRPASILCRDSTTYDSVLVNYNGYEHTFEVRQAHQTVTLDDNLYDLITVYKANNQDAEWFIKGVHYDIATQLANVIYNGKKIKLIRNFNVKVAEITDVVPGETLVKRKFYPVTSYLLYVNSQLKPVRLNKGRIGKLLGDKELVGKLADKHQLNLSKENDVVKFLQYYEKTKFN